MGDLKRLKAKIASTKNIKKITSALEIIATLKLQKTKKQTEFLRNYVDHLIPLLITIERQVDIFAKVRRRDSEQEEISKILPELHVVVSSEKGLCGSLNTILLKDVHNQLKAKKDAVFVFAIGNKAIQFFTKHGYQLAGKLHLADQIDHNDIAPLVAILHEHRTKELYEKITVHYNYFKNTMKYIPTSMQIYPLSRKVWNTIMPDLAHVYAVPQHDEENTEHIMEPDPIALQLAAQEALSRYVILSAVLQNKTSEFASRMIAMKGAKDNANTIVDDLTVAYNKARQDSITQEVLEIVGAKSVIETM